MPLQLPRTLFWIKLTTSTRFQSKVVLVKAKVSKLRIALLTCLAWQTPRRLVVSLSTLWLAKIVKASSKQLEDTTSSTFCTQFSMIVGPDASSLASLRNKFSATRKMDLSRSVVPSWTGLSMSAPSLISSSTPRNSQSSLDKLVRLVKLLRDYPGRPLPLFSTNTETTLRLTSSKTTVNLQDTASASTSSTHSFARLSLAWT